MAVRNSQYINKQYSLVHLSTVFVSDISSVCRCCPVFWNLAADFPADWMSWLYRHDSVLL